MSQNSYHAYPAYEPGPAYFNGSINAPARAFDPRAQAPQPGVKQMEPGMQAILDGAHDARHSISRPFDSYTFPGYEASFHTTSSSLDQGLQALLNGHRPYASREPSVSYANPIANFYNDADGPWNSLRATSQARSSTSNATLTVPVPNLDYNNYRDAPASEISDSGCVADRCKNKDKIWPRLDNFKQHVQRMHQDENMEDMIQRSQCFGNLAAAAPGTPRIESGSPMDNTLAGIDSKTSSPDGSHHNNSLDFGPGQDRNEDSSNSLAPDFKASFPHDQHWEQPPFHGYQVEPVQPAQTPEDQKPTRGKQPDAPKLRELADAATAASHTPGQSKPRNESRSGASKPQSSRRNSIMEDPQKRILGPISNLIASSINQGAANESLDKAVLRALLELEKNKNIITPANHRRNLSLKEDRSSKNAERPPPGFGGPDGTETTISTAEVLQGLAALSKRIRQSARKPNPIVNSSKHRKRHTRPYGCTFSKCFKKFGSKNDWKRHEGSQHFQVETWRCEHQVSHEAPKCAEIFYESKVFEKHLRDSHRIADQKHIDTELRTRRIGRNGQSRFWCGFCQRIIELKTRFVEAWEERFNHIDEHFKLKRPITEWLDIEANKPKGEVEARMDRIDFDDEDPQPASLNASSEGSEGDPNSPSETSPTGASLRGTAERVDADVMILSFPRKGRKRTREEAEGEEDEPVDGEPRRKSRKVAISSLTRMLPQCDCKQGPFAWSLYQSCLYCDHEFCERCDRRKHESSTEESVDYNLWSHVVSR
ncbi:c2h2 type zinc finger domain protein [Neofusicoccum parvum]|nr:c2h2 type zinc finger domain protein [Neofusicoccum parvum]